MLILFRGEKTAVFWLGLVVFGYSVYEFCVAGWQTFVLNPEFGLTYELQLVFPPIVGGIIFIIIGLLIMKAGIRKNNQQTQE